MSAPFYIVGYPRSRTAWLANFLTSGNIFCTHEATSQLSDIADLPSVLATERKYNGCADTLLAAFLPRVMELTPSSKIVCILRPCEEVQKSLLRMNLHPDVSHLEEGVTFAYKHANALRVRFNELDEESIVRQIQEHVAPGEPFDHRRWRLLSDFNVQVTPKRMTQFAVLADEKAKFLWSTRK